MILRPKIAALLPLTIAVVLTVAAYLFFYSRPESNVLYQFFCSRGYYQHFSVFLVFYGLVLAVRQWLRFRPEPHSLKLEQPERTITPDDALVMAGRIPDEYQGTLLGRRMAELFRGFSRQEEIGALVERLAGTDREDLERSYSLLSWVRSLPPLIGLLGTLDGLRGGTRRLVELSGSAALSDIRSALQQFALSSSTAFDTTLLGIGGGLLLSVCIFSLQRRETDHLNCVDDRAEQLARCFQQRSRLEVALQKISQKFSSDFIAQMEKVLKGASSNFARIVREEIQQGKSSDGQGSASQAPAGEQRGAD